MAYCEGGSDYMQNLLIHQTVDRAVNAFTHSQHFYYYLYSVLYCMMPWSLLVGDAILVSIFLCKLWPDDLNCFFLTVTGCTFAILSLIGSKIDIYLIPAYPFIIYLGIICLQRMKRKSWMMGVTAVPAFAFAVVLPVFCVFVFMPEFDYLGHALFYVASAILTGTISLYLLFRRHAMPKVLSLMSIICDIHLWVG